MSQAAPRTVFTHFYQALHRRDHHSWPITGFEDVPDDPDARDPNIYWWKQELEYVARAKIDVLAFMYWAPRAVDSEGGRIGWRRFLQIAAERQAVGYYVPKLCCHYDGMGFGDLAGLNVGEEAGIATVFKHLAEFFDFWTKDGRDQHLFTFNGADVVFMYRPEAQGKCTCPPGGQFVDELKRHFAERYPGRKLYLVLDMLWTWTYDTNDLHANNADNYYFWGASQTGPVIPGGKRFPAEIKLPFGIAAIGPGFYDIGHDQSNTPNSQIGKRKRDWRNGATFREDWAQAMEWRDKAPWVLLETWNLFLERSEITVNNKCGDLFVEICKELVPKFKA